MKYRCPHCDTQFKSFPALYEHEEVCPSREVRLQAEQNKKLNSKRTNSTKEVIP